MPASRGVILRLMNSLVFLLFDASVACAQPYVAWSFHIEPDGSLIDGQPFYHLQLPDDVSQGPVRSAVTA